MKSFIYNAVTDTHTVKNNLPLIVWRFGLAQRLIKNLDIVIDHNYFFKIVRVLYSSNELCLTTGELLAEL